MIAKVNIGGTIFRLTSDDDYLVHVGPVFEPAMVSLFRHFAHGVVLDVGANIGCTALLFAGLARVVHAFEPSPSTYSILQKNTSSMPTIVNHNIGLGLQDSQLELTHAPNNRSGAFVSNMTQASAGHAIESIQIRSMDVVVNELNLDRVDFIKIDVEGFEENILRGSRETLARHRPTVIMEMNHWCLNAFQRRSLPDFLDYLRSVFPILYAVQDNTYLDLHDSNESYAVMYMHILHMRYATLVGSFERSAVKSFQAKYIHGPCRPVKSPGLLRTIKHALLRR